MIRDWWFYFKVIAWGFFHPLAHAAEKDVFLDRLMKRWDNGQW